MFKKNTTRPGLDEAIELALEELKLHDQHTEQYASIVDQLVKLYAMENSKQSNRVSKDGLLAVIGNLLGIGIIIGYEHAHPIASKALGFVGKVPRL